MLIENLPNVIYVADPNYLNELSNELGDVSHVFNDLVFSSTLKTDICFALDAWINPQILHFESISQAVRALRAAGKFWYLHPIENIRRSRLIESELRKLPDLNHAFPLTEEIPQIGCFSLLDKNTLVYCNTRWKKAPLGNYHFIEDKINPPNRAYLKLWEALSLWGTYPTKGELAVDLGASPGGWTYVCQMLGADVIAVDKAPLAEHIAKLPRVQFQQQSAFALDPNSFEKDIDWLLCDVACYPERTFDLVTQWIQSGKAKRMIFTLKLQGETNLKIIEKFQAIPKSRVIHMMSNKHEATFFYPAPSYLFL
ncbi:MAG: SAM-dependent methyltransferase [Gammaproteobacteria bacterium]|nr:SAM-dependent methyltransferase [Gammaproteobacteria bacterium]